MQWIKGGANMDNEYVFKDIKYNNAVKDIKSALLDIIVIENNKLAIIEEQIASEVNEEKKQKLKEQQKIESETLDKTLGNINLLIKNIETLDSINKEIAMINGNELAVVVEKSDDEDIKKAFNNAVIDVDNTKEEVVNIINEEVNSDPVISENNQDLKDSISVINEGISIDNQDSEKNVTVQVEDEQIVPELKSVNKQLDMIKEQEQEIKNNENDNPLEKARDLLVFKKTTKNTVKAILVRQEQLKKLADSRKKQRVLMDAKKVFEGYKYMDDVKDVVNDKLIQEQNKEGKLIDQIGTGEITGDKERLIEDLMVKASIYYNEGETLKAQEIYDQISKLNAEVDNVDNNHNEKSKKMNIN